MQYPKSPHPVPDRRLRLRHWAGSAFAFAAIAAQVTPAFATIDNTATATGTPPTGPNVTGTSNTVNVPVAPAAPHMTVAKSAGAWVDVNSDGVIKGGDTIQFTYTVTNDGNVTMYNVAPNDVGPKFGPTAVAGTGTLGSYSPATATIAPGANQVFTATYTLSNSDAFRAAGQTPAANSVTNTSKATGNVASPSGSLIAQANVTAGSASKLLPANPKITVTKSYALTKTSPNTATDAETNDTILYTYTAFNAGNVPLTAVKVDDVHEGSALPTGTAANETLLSDGPLGGSSNGPVNDGVWATMAAGATVTFTYNHTVTLTEFNNQ
jgi:uncharacterized repeat protein (TIGR01451 family)